MKRKFKDNELNQLYQDDSTFRRQVKKSEENYQFLQYKSLESIQNNPNQTTFIQKIVMETNQSVYFLYGFMQPHPKKQRTKMTLEFFYHFRPQANQKFTFVYFNHKTPSSDYFIQFKTLFLMVPLSILQNMKQFYLIKPTFYIKAVAFMDFGTNHKYFSKNYSTLEKCQELCEIISLSPQDFVSFVPEVISHEFPEKYRLRMSLRNFRVNVYGQNISESSIKENNEFEEMIQGLIKKQILRLQDYEVGQLGVPIILQVLVSYFKNNPSGVRFEGLFRKSISIEEQQSVFEQLSKHNYEYVQKITNPHLIAALIKKFFFNLKEPIITFALFKYLMDEKCKVNKEELKSVITSLPKLNFITLMYLLDFLKKYIIQNDKYNKMTANNIAICFSPCFMRSEVASSADFAYTTKTIFLTNLLIKDFDYIFGSEQQRKTIFEEKIITHSRMFQQTIKQELCFDQQQQRFNKKEVEEPVQFAFNPQKEEIQIKRNVMRQFAEIILKTKKVSQKKSPQIEKESFQSSDEQQQEPSSEDVKNIILNEIKKINQIQTHDHHKMPQNNLSEAVSSEQMYIQEETTTKLIIDAVEQDENYEYVKKGDAWKLGQ